jgi:hypothetical protein
MMTRVPTFDGGERAAMAFSDLPYNVAIEGAAVVLPDYPISLEMCL